MYKSATPLQLIRIATAGFIKKIFVILMLFAFNIADAQTVLPQLKISANGRFLQTKNGKPFFWLGDTGWLLFSKCSRENAIKYLDDRMQKGFNVIQVMLVHDINLAVNVYGDSSIHNKDVSQFVIEKNKYGFWNHVDFIIDEAAKRGLYMALVPVWGANIKHVNAEQAKIYATFLANRYKNKSNIIWLNGGDIKGSDKLEIWNTIGRTIKDIDKNHLIGFHPRGRSSSSNWFNNEAWLDFNMFQSGHRSYEQDTLSNETLHYGEDNWKYANDDYKLKPIKPTFDGEPSYEDIPYGLHDSTQPYWKDFEIRRYAYWSVFAGGCGFTYGQNAVMQFYSPGDIHVSYSPKMKWQDGLNAKGSSQMQYLKSLILSKSYFDRLPAQELIINNGKKYNRIAACKGKDYALFYAYNSIGFNVNLKKFNFIPSKYYWFNPRNGIKSKFNYTSKNNYFEVPVERKIGNDWVLIIEK